MVVSMAYRDPAEAARARLRDARAELLHHEERVAPELLGQLAAADRRALEERAARVGEAVDEDLARMDVAAMEAALPLVRDYAEHLRRVVGAAPKLAQRFNRLPRTFPKKDAPPPYYEFPDIYDKVHQQARAAVHRAVRKLDPQAGLESAKRGYDDVLAKPMLAAARMELDGARIRVLVTHQRLPGETKGILYHSALQVRTRPSTPKLSLSVTDPIDSLLLWLRIRSEPSVGDQAFDRAFFIRGDADAAALVLRPDVQRALMELPRSWRFSLEVGDGLARLCWSETEPGNKLEEAATAIAAIRNTPPVRLLRPRRAMLR
jgi:hypothetical protein